MSCSLRHKQSSDLFDGLGTARGCSTKYRQIWQSVIRSWLQYASTY